MVRKPGESRPRRLGRHCQGADRLRSHVAPDVSATAYDRIVAATEEKGRTALRRNGNGVMTLCPAHDDARPSLGITPIEGSVLLHCFAGCETVDVLAALGLSLADLYDHPRGALYGYTDRNGKPTRTVRRTPAKKFSQSGATNSQPELYRLPAVIKAVGEGRQVYLCEGEKDVHAMETLGAVATTAPMGGSNFSKVDASPLYGALVIAVPDQDQTGSKWLFDVCAALQSKAKTLTVVRPKEGKDAADHIAAGYGLDQFVPAATPDLAEVLAKTTDRVALLANIRDTLSLEGITKHTFRIVKTISDPPHFRMETDAGIVTLGPPGRWARRPGDFSVPFLDVGEMPVLPPPGQPRNALFKMIVRAAEPEDIGSEATHRGQMTAWLDLYLSQRPPVDDVGEAMASEYPFLDHDGRIVLFPHGFKTWLYFTYWERISSAELGRRLRSVGAEPSKVNINDRAGRRTSRGTWLLPLRGTRE